MAPPSMPRWFGEETGPHKFRLLRRLREGCAGAEGVRGQHVRSCGSHPVARGQQGNQSRWLWLLLQSATHWAAFKKQTCFHTPGGRKSELGVPARSGSGHSTLPGRRQQIPITSHGGRTVSELFGVLFIRTLIPFMRIPPSWTNTS